MALLSLAIPTVLTCLLFPFIASMAIEPYIAHLYGQTITLSRGNSIIMVIMLAMMVVTPIGFLLYSKKRTFAATYLAGANVSGSLRLKGPWE